MKTFAERSMNDADKSYCICSNNQLFMLNTLRFKPSSNRGDGGWADV